MCTERRRSQQQFLDLLCFELGITGRCFYGVFLLDHIVLPNWNSYFKEANNIT